MDELSDFQDEGMPMQRLAHLSSLNLQVSLDYLYCLFPCSTLFSRNYLIDTGTQSLSLSWESLTCCCWDLSLPLSVMTNDVGQQSGHRPAKWQKTTIDYIHKGYHVCRNTFTFLHGVSNHRMHAIKKHFLDNGYQSENMATLATIQSMPLLSG